MSQRIKHADMSGSCTGFKRPIVRTERSSFISGSMTYKPILGLKPSPISQWSDCRARLLQTDSISEYFPENAKYFHAFFNRWPYSPRHQNVGSVIGTITVFHTATPLSYTPISSLATNTPPVRLPRKEVIPCNNTQNIMKTSTASSSQIEVSRHLPSGQ